MPLQVKNKMEQRHEWVTVANRGDISLNELAKRAGVCRKTLYNWVRRFNTDGPEGLEDRSTRPRNSPRLTKPEIEEAVIGVRDRHPKWGAKKIRKVLENSKSNLVPAASTVHRILERHGKVDAPGVGGKPWKRFEREAPNELWQMDFKGHFAIRRGRCHPLTVIDDHSRFALTIQACRYERGITVKERLTETFSAYGLPDAIMTDNGPPWAQPISRISYTALGVWLIRLGIRLKRTGAYHPQTNGKVERFHRSLKAEVLQARTFRSLDECQDAFDKWRYVYNFERPHQAIGMSVPSEKYSISPRAFPKSLPEIVYGPDDEVRKVQDGGWVHFRGREFRIGKPFNGLLVAVRPTVDDGEFDIYCVRQKLLHINLRDAPSGASE